MIFFTTFKEISGVLCLVATLASCATSARDNAEWGIWSYLETTDSCEVSEIVKLYKTSGEFRRGTTCLGALLKRGEDALLTQRYRDSDRHLLRYIISSPDYLARPGCVSAFEIERSIDGFREGFKMRYNFLQDEHGRFCRKHVFSYRLGAAANNRLTSGTVMSCIDPSTYKFSFDIDRTS